MSENEELALDNALGTPDEAPDGTPDDGSSGDGTIFDSVYKTLVHKAPHLIVPLVNEVFGTAYPDSALVVHFSNEHETPSGSKVSDSVFQLQDKMYHIECQSTADNNMVVRMIEYDFAIALEGAISSGEPYEMSFPESCVLFLRHTSKTPDVLEMKVSLPDGESFMYGVKVMKAQLYGSEELFEKRLLLLLPFYLMRYEKELSEIDGDSVKTAQLVAECVDIRSRLEAATLAVGDAVLYEQLVELIIRVSNHVFGKHEGLGQEVRRAMGGEVLELIWDRAERLEREAREQGLRDGREQGIEQGRLIALAELVADGTLTPGEAATRLGIDEAEFANEVAKLERT